MATRTKARKTAGLYQLIGGANNGDITSGDILARIFPRMARQNQQRLHDWAEELRFWEEYGEIYINLEKARPYTNLSRTLEKLFLPKSGDVWLDVGCGPLRMSELICGKCNGDIGCVEAVDVVLKPAREKLDKLTNQDITLPVNLRYLSITDQLPYPDDYFDGIGANLILPYVIDFVGTKGKVALEGVLREMFRILKPGGHLVWSTPKHNVNFVWVFLASLPDMLNLYEYIAHRDFTRIMQGAKILKHALAIQEKGKKGVYTFLPREELEELLRQIGFVDPCWMKTFTQQVWVNRTYKPV